MKSFVYDNNPPYFYALTPKNRLKIVLAFH